MKYKEYELKGIKTKYFEMTYDCVCYTITITKKELKDNNYYECFLNQSSYGITSFVIGIYKDKSVSFDDVCDYLIDYVYYDEDYDGNNVFDSYVLEKEKWESED